METKSLNDAMYAFIKENCIPYLDGGGEIGKTNPKAIDCEIRIKLHEDGTGYIHLYGQDSSTHNFTLSKEENLKEAIEVIKTLVNRYGSASDSLMWQYKQDALKFLLSHDPHYQKLSGKKKTEYANRFLES